MLSHLLVSSPSECLYEPLQLTSLKTYGQEKQKVHSQSKRQKEWSTVLLKMSAWDINQNKRGQHNYNQMKQRLQDEIPDFQLQGHLQCSHPCWLADQEL